MYDDQWQDDALCPQTDVDPVVWFPKKGGSTATAKRICSMCTVQEPCVAYAFDLADQLGYHHGVFGGTTAAQRDQMDDPREGEAQREPLEVARIRQLAGLGWGDPAIGRELDKTPGSVSAMRRRHRIPAGQPTSSRPARDKAAGGVR